ncbi:MAG: DUF177 domain-containing protein [Bacilli bacterium]|nr:DUF177 domain-containing protein [Bacilli bacterium]
MLINLSKLITNISDEITFNDEVEIDKSYLENTDIRDISKVKVEGSIRPYENNFELNMNIKCTLTLICSISLKDVKYDVDIDVNEVIGESTDEVEIEENNKIINNTIDLIPIIWQNIILEVPLKVISPDVKRENLEGDGWKFVTEEKVDNKDIDPRLEKLKDFLNE